MASFIDRMNAALEAGWTESAVKAASDRVVSPRRGRVPAEISDLVRYLRGDSKDEDKASEPSKESSVKARVSQKEVPAKAMASTAKAVQKERSIVGDEIIARSGELRAVVRTSRKGAKYVCVIGPMGRSLVYAPQLDAYKRAIALLETILSKE